MNEDQRLWRAVILQSFEDVASTNDLNVRQAKAWFEASIGTSYADFVNVCENAGFEAETVKKAYAIFVEAEDKKKAFRELRRKLNEE